MTLSLNEVESTVWKAARGAGLAWGLAEELGQAARWMAARGLDWARPVVACLDDVARAKGHVSRPVLIGDVWQPAAGTTTLSPLLCGPLISDLVSQLAGKETALRFGAMAHPILLLPFVARTAEALNSRLLLSWPDARWLCRGRDTRFSTLESPAIARSVMVSAVEADAGFDGEPLKETGTERGTIGPDLLQRLEKWVRLTYVPASAESRLAGAGAGLTDND